MSKTSIKKSLKKFFLENYKYIIFCTVLAIVNFMLIYTSWFFLDNQLLPATVSTIIFIVLSVLIFWLKKRKEFPIHKLFLIAASVIGLVYVFITPLGGAPDEPNHFRRAYEISRGSFLSNHQEDGVGGNTLPNSINILDVNSVIHGSIEESMTISGESFQKFGNTSLYSPIPYIPQVIGIEIGKVLHLPMFAIFYLARIFNLACWVIIIYFAIKYIPIGKEALSLLLLSPISLQAASSCQADALTNAAVIGLIAFVLYKIKRPTRLTRMERAVAITLPIVIALCKIVYIPICLLLFLLPVKCFKNKKSKIIQVLAIVIGATILNLIWLALSSSYLVEFQPGVNSSGQVHYILTHPFQYLATIFHTYAGKGLGYFTQAFGTSLGWFKIDIAGIYIMFLILFCFYTYLKEDKKHFSLTPLQKTVFAAVLLIIVALISTSLYVQWTAFEETTIEGIQGRYFIPILPLILFLVTPLALKADKNSPLYTLCLICAINLYSLNAISAYYALTTLL